MQQSNGFTAFSLVASSCQIVTPLCFVAQLVEQRTVNPWVAGSSPAKAAITLQSTKNNFTVVAEKQQHIRTFPNFVNISCITV